MTKVYVPVPSKEYIDLYSENDINGFFLGIENFSINFNNFVKLQDLEDYINIIKKNNKEVYISLNKLYYDEDIKKLKDLILKISKYNIDGISFCDVGVYNIVKENNLSINLIWDSFHLGTNYETVNFWNKRGVNSAILSTEILSDEIIEIKKNTDAAIGVNLYGYLNMVTSSRSLLTNYFKYTNIKKESDKYLMEVNGEKYPITEVNGESNIFSSKVLNGIMYLPKLIENNIDFIYLNDYLLNPIKFYNVVEAFCTLRIAPNDKEYVQKLKKVVEINTPFETYDGFLNKKTIYKVKNDE